MTSSIKLEQQYSGDRAWHEFVDAAPAGYDEYSEAEELESALSGHRDLAVVVYALIGRGARAWIQSKNRMLDDLAPVDCLADRTLLRRLRSMLMMMPQ